jgi:EAL domain-containing protein (putative c-di-GMP-specific phosphodiesterase class I)
MDDRNDRVLVETMVTMGRLLDLQVVAEGVEQVEQLNLLKEYGCHYYQGYFCSPAVCISEFEAMLQIEDKLMLTS